MAAVASPVLTASESSDTRPSAAAESASIRTVWPPAGREQYEPEFILGKARRVSCQTDVFADADDGLIDTRSLHRIDGRALDGPDPLAAIVVDGPDRKLDMRIAPENIRDFALDFDDFIYVVGEQRVMRECGAWKKQDRQRAQFPDCTVLEHFEIPLTACVERIPEPAIVRSCRGAHRFHLAVGTGDGDFNMHPGAAPLKVWVLPR